MKIILVISSFLVFAHALPTYKTDPIDRTDPENYKNIEILILESAVDQDGGYSYSFENDDGSKVSQEGEHRIVDEEHAIESIRGSYSYNDDNGKPVSLTYTADENGFRPIGAHLPTPPPIPLEILKSLRFLATAKPFVDDQLYDYKPKKKVYRGRQYNSGNVVTRSRNNDRANNFPEPIVENIPDETEKTSLNAEENPDAIQTRTSQENLDKAQQQTSAVQSNWEVVNETKKKIENVVKASIEKTSKITQSATRETAAASIAAIREEAAKVTDSVKSEVNKIAQATGSGTPQTPGPTPVEQESEPNPTPLEQIPEPSAETDKEVPAPVGEPDAMNEKRPKIASDVVSTTDEVFIEADVGTTEDSQIDLNVELSP